MLAIYVDPYIIDSLMPDLNGHDHKPSAFMVYLWLWRSARESRARRVTCSYQDIAANTGLAKRTVQSAISHLARRKLIAIRQETTTAVPEYEVLTPWRRIPRGPPVR